MTIAPPGWYSSGNPGEERWWDGQAWTSNSRPASPGLAGASQPSTFWRGSKDGSLIGAILCAVFAFVAFGATILALLSGSITFLAPALATLSGVAFAVILFLNYRGLARNEALRRRSR